MAIDQDPYRTLGLSRGATIDEIKRAYRRLAKIHHPDAAGEKNVPRFLAIQAAYEQLAGPGAVRRSPVAPRRPWEADPDRGEATRRAYGGRQRGPAPGAGASRRPGPEPTPGNPPGAGEPSAGAGPTARPRPRPRPASSRSSRRGPEERASAGADAGAGATDPPPPRGPRERKRKAATLGSTSYDGVDGPFEPDWRGASWYGTTSGTYWTLNPKEYADPRKHGPEYQARARRATRSRAPEGPAEEPVDASSTKADAPPDPDPVVDDAQATARPTHTTTSWWESTAGTTEPPPPVADVPGDRPTSRATTPPPPPDIGRALGDIGRALTDPGYGGQRGRVMRALLGWLPIAFGVSWFIGEMTGCGRFAATCTDFADPLTLVIQVVALALLLLFPLVGSIAAIGAVALLGAAVAAALILSATGGAADTDSRRSALGAVLLIAWLGGIAVAVMRRLRAPSSTTRPVS